MGHPVFIRRNDRIFMILSMKNAIIISKLQQRAYTGGQSLNFAPFHFPILSSTWLERRAHCQSAHAKMRPAGSRCCQKEPEGPLPGLSVEERIGK